MADHRRDRRWLGDDRKSCWGSATLPTPRTGEPKHYVETAIKAHALYKRDVEYVVKDGEVIIVDTGGDALMPGRRWSDVVQTSRSRLRKM